MPGSTAPPAASRSTSRSWAWPPTDATAERLLAGGHPTAASSATATPRSTARPGCIHSQQAHRRHGPHARRRRVLAGRLRRRHLLPTATRSSTARRVASTSTSPSSAWRPRPTAAATGWWPPTAASSPTATRSSTARPARIHLVQPIVGMAAMPDGGGYWFTAADGGLFNYGNAPFLRRRGRAGPRHGRRHGHRRGPDSSGGFRRPGDPAHAHGPVPFVRPLPANVRHYAAR